MCLSLHIKLWHEEASPNLSLFCHHITVQNLFNALNRGCAGTTSPVVVPFYLVMQFPIRSGYATAINIRLGVL